MMNNELTYKEILEQERIGFENIKSRTFGSEYSSYGYKSGGMIIHYLYVYHLKNYDTVTIGDGEVKYYKENVATYIWDDELKIPIFNFTEEYKFPAKEQEIYVKNLRKLYRRKEFLINEIRNADLNLISIDRLIEIKKVIKQAKSDTVYSNDDLNPIGMIV